MFLNSFSCFPSTPCRRSFTGSAVIMPMTFFLPIVNSIVTKGVGLNDLWRPVLSLTALTVVIFFAGAHAFRQQLD